jgi:hypothetical protein
MIPDTAQRNEIGQVALKNLRRRPMAAQCKDKIFVFVSWVDIAIAWVDEEDVPCLLQKRHQCCDNKKKKIITYASEDDVRRWTNKGGR